MTKSLFLETALEAVQKAEEVIMSFYENSETDFETKHDNSPVTLADKGAEAAIKEHIRKAFPDHGFIGEEEGVENFRSEFQWIIDPIDGTKNFIRKIPLFTTELALWHQNTPILGISYNPVSKLLFSAVSGQGAYKNQTDHLFVKNSKTLAEACTSSGSIKSFAQKNIVDKYIKLSQKVFYCKSLEAAQHYDYFLNNKLDAIIDGGVKIWDIAAITCIMAEAGATVSDIKGQPITLDSNTFVASTNKDLHRDIIELLNS